MSYSIKVKLWERIRPSQRRLWQWFLIAQTFVSFVACENSRSTEAKTSSITQNSGGSGVGYDGKILGNYYRFIPGYSCAAQPAAKEIIQVQDQSTTLISNSILQCQSENRNLANELLGQSPLQSEFLTYNDLIFKHLEGEITEIPEQLPEVLCRDDFAHPQVEIITHYDRAESVALGRIYRQNTDGSVAILRDFPVARSLSPYQVEYRSTDLQLSLDLQHPIPGTHRFVGQHSDPIKGKTKLICVTGGLLDTSAWPLQQITDTYTSAVTLNYATNSVVVTQEDATGSVAGRKLIQITSDKKYKDLTAQILGSDYNINTGYTGSYGNTPLVFTSTSRKSGDFRFQDFFLDLLHSVAIPFLAKEEILNSGLAPLSTGEMIYDVIDSRSTGILRKLDLQTRQFTNVYSASFLRKQVLPGTSKVVTASNSTMRSVLIHDLSAETQVTISPPIAEDCHPADRFTYGIFPRYGDQSFFLLMPKADLAVIRYDCGSSSRLYGVSLTQTPHVDFGAGACIWDFSADSNWIEIGQEVTINTSYARSYQSCQGTQVRHYDLSRRTNFLVGNNPLFASDRLQNFSKVQAIPMIINAPSGSSFYYGQGNAFLKFNENLIFGMTYSSEKPRLIQFDPVRNQTQEICANTKGDKISLGALDKNKAYLLSYSGEEQIYFSYEITVLASGATNCAMVNSFPSTKKKLLEVALSPIGLGLVLGDEIKDSPTSVYFMPFNGKPTYLLNLFEQDIYTALKFQINTSTRELFLTGLTKGNKIPLLYKFLLPDFTN